MIWPTSPSPQPTPAPRAGSSRVRDESTHRSRRWTKPRRRLYGCEAPTWSSWKAGFRKLALTPPHSGEVARRGRANFPRHPRNSFTTCSQVVGKMRGVANLIHTQGDESQMRRGFGLIGALVTVIVLVIVGVIAYNVGWSDGVNTHLPAGTATAPGPYYGYGYGFHPFFAGFGILWFLFILFGIFFLLRLAFFGRMWRGGGWGYGKGMGRGGHRPLERRDQERAKSPPRQAAPPPTPLTNPPPPPDPHTR